MLRVALVRTNEGGKLPGRMPAARFALFSAPAGALSLLAGCGGGDGGLASTPPPPQSYTKLADATASTSLAAAAATFQVVRMNNAPVPTSGSQASNIEISYDPASKTYTLRGTPVIGSTTSLSQNFGPSDAISDTPGSYQNGTTTVSRTETRRLDIGTTPLTYTNFGRWTVRVQTGTDQSTDTAYFAYGVPTATSDMPKTGSASYALQASGTTGLNPVSGTGSLTANFAASTVDVSLALQAREISRPGNNLFDLATVTGSGTIGAAGSNPSFSSNLSGGGYTGSINGRFYGPQATEVGGAFAITRDGVGGGPIAGAVIGKKN
jgi:hypothetical protein